MRDKKFLVAIIVIVVLALVIFYLTFVGPKIQNYITTQQNLAQENIVRTIMQIIDRQGYVVLGDQNNTVILVKYQPPEQSQLPEVSEVPEEQPA